MCELLIDHGALVEEDGLLKSTALHLAVQFGCKKVAELLVTRKAAVDVQDEEGLLPIHLAAETGNKQLCELLIAYNMPVDIQDGQGGTPLHFAARNGHEEVCGFLVAQRALVNAPDDESYTPLYGAANNGHVEVCKLLVAHAARVDAQTDEGLTPLHGAAQYGYEEVCEFLIAQKASVEARLMPGYVFNDDPMGQFTPLHLAVYGNRLEAVKALVAAGADTGARTQDGKTALDLARQRGYREIVGYLETREEQLPKKGSLPLVKASFSTLLSAIAQGDNNRLVSLLGANTYSIEALRVVLATVRQTGKYYLAVWMIHSGLIPLEASSGRLVERVAIT
jgi:ankyrin repeat protein